MGILVSNGNLLYRKTGFLVRTPITIRLSADEMAGYSVCGSYTANGFPLSGFKAGVSDYGCEACYNAAVSAYVNPTNRLQIWRQATTGVPEFIFHNGRFTPSGGLPEDKWATSEAFIQLCGYHFTIPASLQGLPVSGLRVSFRAGGTLMANGEPRQASVARRNWAEMLNGVVATNESFQYPYNVTYGGTVYTKPEYWLTHRFTDTSFPVRFTAAANRPADNATYSTLSALPYDEIDLSAITEEECASGATNLGWKQIWGNGEGGAIPVVSSALESKRTFSTDTIASVADGNRSFWVFAHMPIFADEVIANTREDLWRTSPPPSSALQSRYVSASHTWHTPSAYYGWDPRNQSSYPPVTAQSNFMWFMSASLWDISIEVDLG